MYLQSLYLYDTSYDKYGTLLVLVELLVFDRSISGKKGKKRREKKLHSWGIKTKRQIITRPYPP